MNGEGEIEGLCARLHLDQMFLLRRISVRAALAMVATLAQDFAFLPGGGESPDAGSPRAH